MLMLMIRKGCPSPRVLKEFHHFLGTNMLSQKVSVKFSFLTVHIFKLRIQIWTLTN